jgi:hypothetical protein
MDFFNSHACLQQLRQMPRIGQGALNSETPPGGFDWLAPRFYRGKSGLRGLFTNSPLPSGGGPTEYNESSLYRVARAGPRWRAQLRELIGTFPTLEKRLSIPIRHRKGIAPGRSGIGLIPPLPEKYEWGTEFLYVSTRQMTKSPYLFNSLNDWRNILITLIDLGTGVNEMVRRRVGFGSAVYIRRTIT